MSFKCGEDSQCRMRNITKLAEYVNRQDLYVHRIFVVCQYLDNRLRMWICGSPNTTQRKPREPARILIASSQKTREEWQDGGHNLFYSVKYLCFICFVPERSSGVPLHQWIDIV